MDVIIVYIGVFFALSGGYSIIESLSKLGKDKSDSSIQTGWFKLNAPAGFIYGIVAIGIVILLIKFHDYGAQTDKIENLENQLSEIKNVDLNKSKNLNLINVKFNREKPISIFDGKILMNYIPREIEFSGIIGISKTKNGEFKNSKIEISKGMKFYFKTNDSIIWGINVLKSNYDTELEIYRE